jgi:DNA-binding transcriptional LysR family regulator
MNLSRLRYFLAVADAQNIARAARALNIAQPALSRQLRVLEDEVGSALFERYAKGVRLTPAGSALLEHAREAVRSADAGLTAARVAAASTTVVNVSPPDWPHRADLVAAAVVALRERMPDVEVAFNVAPWTVSPTSLRSGAIDLGFGVIPVDAPKDPDLSAELLLPEPGLSALLPARHPLARRSSVRLLDLKELPALIPPRAAGGARHDQMAAVIRSGGYEPKIVDAPLNYSAASQLAAVGAGWILTVNSAAQHTPPGTVVLPIDDATLMCGFYVLTRAGDTRPALTAFLECLREAAVAEA